MSSPVPEGRDDRASERVIVIEFRWRGPNGVQPVIYLDRLLLH